jgi:hypothetical protein
VVHVFLDGALGDPQSVGDADVSPITGVRGLRPTIIGHDHPIDT